MSTQLKKYEIDTLIDVINKRLEDKINKETEIFLNDPEKISKFFQDNNLSIFEDSLKNLKEEIELRDRTQKNIENIPALLQLQFRDFCPSIFSSHWNNAFKSTSVSNIITNQIKKYIRNKISENTSFPSSSDIRNSIILLSNKKIDEILTILAEKYGIEV